MHSALLISFDLIATNIKYIESGSMPDGVLPLSISVLRLTVNFIDLQVFEVRFWCDVQQRLVDQLDSVLNVIPLDHFHGRMHIT